MDIKNNETLIELKTRTLSGMIDYLGLSEGEASYTKSDVDECGKILDLHIENISKCTDKPSAMTCVENTVLKLNELNESADCELIETDQREDICEFIIQAGVLLGFNTDEDDVTEDWREW